MRSARGLRSSKRNNLVSAWFKYAFCGSILLGALNLDAYELPGKNKSYLNTKYISFGVGSGTIGFADQTGISGNTGFSIRATAGHHLNRYVQLVFAYQFSNFDLDSPDPLNTLSTINTNASMNQESLQAVFSYPDFFVQPYVSLGVGGYNWFDVSRETTLSFPINVFVPTTVGFRTYIIKNVFSFDAEFAYNWTFGENQKQSTLSLLNLNKVSFNTYGVTGTFTLHLF